MPWDGDHPSPSRGSRQVRQVSSAAMSSSAGPVPPPRPATPPLTDPSGFDAVESLYRQTDGTARGASGVRHFQPALRPPEDTDGYAWLYRPAEATEPVTTPVFSTPVSSTTTSGVAVLTPAPALNLEPSWSAAPASRRRWPVLLLLAGALLGTGVLALLAPCTF